MDKKVIWLTVGLLILLIGGMFAFAALQRSEQAGLVNEPVMPVEIEPADRFSDVTHIDAKYFYIANEHVIVGELMMPTPCDLLDAEVLIMESMPEQVRFDFFVINSAEMCAQVMSLARFMFSAAASPAATLSATLEGRPVTLNLVPGLPGESPDDFELFIKG